MIKSKFAFIQIQKAGLFEKSSELREPRFSPSPRVLISLLCYYCDCAHFQLISMLNPIMFQ